MDNEIQKFVNESFGEIRTVTINNESWFVVKDVCDILGIANLTDALNKGLEDFERARFNLSRHIAPDGTAHLQTRIYTDGISYITKLLRKYGYWEVVQYGVHKIISVKSN